MIRQGVADDNRWPDVRWQILPTGYSSSALMIDLPSMALTVFVSGRSRDVG